jgi:hypothetical protein
VIEVRRAQRDQPHAARMQALERRRIDGVVDERDTTS